MAEIYSSDLDGQHEGQPITGPTSTDGTLDDQHEGRPIVGFEIPSGTSLVVDSAYHDDSAPNLTITETPVAVTLTVADAYHAHAAENLTITTQGASVTLSVDACNNLHTADSIVLTALHLLTAADCYHDHAPPNLTLEQFTGLSIQSSAHEHSAGAITLVQKNVLSVSSSYSEHAAGAADLTTNDLEITIFDQTAALVPSGTGYTRGNNRLVFSAAGAFSNHNQIRILLGGQSYKYTITKMSVGPRAGSTDDFSAAPTVVTFSGAESVTVEASSNVWSDWIDFDCPSGDIIIHVFCDASYRPSVWNDDRAHYWNFGSTVPDDSENLTVSYSDRTDTRFVKTIKVAERYALAIDSPYHALVDPGVDIPDRYLSTDDSAHETTAGQVLITDRYLSVNDLYHVHVVGEASPSLDLIVGSAAHNTVSAALDLAQVSHIAVDDANHDHAAAAVGITQAHNLAPAEGAHVIDSTQIGAFTGTANLVTQAAYHALASDEIHLTGLHIIAVADAFDEQAAGAITLTQAHNLDVADAAQDQAADAIALTQEHSLDVADAYNVHIGDEVHHLSGAGTLDIQWDCVHGHTVEAVDPLWITLAQLENAVHVHAVSPIILAQLNRLAVEHAYHLHIVDAIIIPALLPVEYTQLFSLTPKLSIRTLTPNTTVEHWDGVERIAS